MVLPMSDGWLVARQHVVPVNDTHEHDLTLNCWCKPKVDDGVVIHNSFDGRELFERGEGWRYPT